MHTKGPWILIEGGPLEGDTVITTQERMNGDIIPIVDMDTDYEGEIGIEQEANAKLIVAAPELLDAGKALLSLYDDGLSLPRDGSALKAAMEQLETAITKATIVR